MDTTQRMNRAIDGARNQYRAMFKNMAASCANWHMHVGSAGYVLLQEGAQMDVPLPVALRGVHAMTEERMLINLRQDARSREFKA